VKLIARMALFTSLLFSCPSGRCQTVCPDEKRAEQALRVVREHSHAAQPLRAALLPNLTDDVISLQTSRLRHALGSDVIVAIFYKVTPSIYQLDGNKVASETIELDAEREWLVAVGPGDEAYLLEGSDDAVGEFNRLVRDLHLQVVDESGALSVFDFFLKVTKGQEGRAAVVPDDMKLESVALDDFRLRFPTIKREAAFRSWWARIPATKKQTIMPPKAIQAKNGFDVRYFLYRQGEVLGLSLPVKDDGTLGREESRVIFQ